MPTTLTAYEVDLITKTFPWWHPITITIHVFNMKLKHVKEILKDLRPYWNFEKQGKSEDPDIYKQVCDMYLAANNISYVSAEGSGIMAPGFTWLLVMDVLATVIKSKHDELIDKTQATILLETTCMDKDLNQFSLIVDYT